jgi:GNAT superfamily N-acetyltransferase
LIRDAAAWARVLASMRAFFSTGLCTTSDFRVVELDGVIACVTPSIPDRSLPNSVLYEREEALEAALPELARAYDEAGVRAWTVWAPEHDERARRLLADAGHVLDATPAAMILDLAELEPPRSDDPVPDSEPSNADLGRVNDRAFGLTDAFAAMLGEGPADPAHAYVARVDGEAAACVGTFDHDGDCSVYWVAVVPEARGRGLAAGLMRRALVDGRERGCAVSTLQATKLGQPVYERLGYRAFGTFEMWERRAPAP